MESEKTMQEEPQLDDMLEKIVFEEKNLQKLRNAINRFQSGELSIKAFREQLLLLRVEILDALKLFVPFQINLVSVNKSVSEFAEEGSNSSQLQQDLKERNELLETIGSRLNKIFENLAKNKNT